VLRHEVDALLEYGSIAALKRADTQHAVLAPSIAPRPREHARADASTTKRCCGRRRKTLP
jgi:hypothetical protein